MNTMDKLFAELEAELTAQFNSITPEQHAEKERRRAIQREWEEKHTAIETEEDRNDRYEYPDDDDEE